MGSNPGVVFFRYLTAHECKSEKSSNNGDNFFSRVCSLSIMNTDELLQVPKNVKLVFSQKLEDVLFNDCTTNALLTHSSHLIIK